MRLQAPWIARLGGLGLASLLRHWMATLRYQAAFYDPTVDPVHPACRGPAIFLFWHEYIPALFYIRSHSGLAMLLSRHRDAEFLARAAHIMGFDTVRGSTTRGGLSAIRQLQRKGRTMHLAITPDGPQGPRRQLASGCIFLASRLQVPLVSIGIGYHRPWRNRRAWDHFAIPRPGSQVRVVVGPPLQIPQGADKEQLEEYRVRVQEQLNQLTALAEAWAEDGRPLESARVVRRAVPPRQVLRALPPAATEPKRADENSYGRFRLPPGRVALSGPGRAVGGEEVFHRMRS